MSEVIIRGLAFYYDGEKLFSLTEHSNALAPVWARSLLKPWQFLANYDLDDEIKKHHAMALSSHQGESFHMKALRDFSQDIQVDSSKLVCPLAMPMKIDQKNIDSSSNRLFHPCSGKHLWMLGKYQIKSGQYDYANKNRPSYARLLKVLETYFGDLRNTHESTDTCGLATWAFPVEKYFIAWQRLASEKSKGTSTIRDLMTKEARLIGGTGRLDSELLARGNGRLLAKEGADGLLMIQEIPSGSTKGGAVFIKIESGYDSKNMRLALYCLLKRNRSQLSAEFLRILDYCQMFVDETLSSEVGLVF